MKYTEWYCWYSNSARFSGKVFSCRSVNPCNLEAVKKKEAISGISRERRFCILGKQKMCILQENISMLLATSGTQYPLNCVREPSPCPCPSMVMHSQLQRRTWPGQPWNRWDRFARCSVRGQKINVHFFVTEVRLRHYEADGLKQALVRRGEGGGVGWGGGVMLV